MNHVRRSLLAVLLALGMPLALLASDPPHDTVTNAGKTGCLACHLTHKAPGGTLTSTAGNANLCLVCHVSGGTATAKAFAAGDLALPTGGLPSTIPAAGNSHRWDSGPQGHIVRIGGATTASTGTITPSGTYTGAYPTTLEIKIVGTGGAVGTAQFQWRSTSVAGAWGVSSANIATATTPVAIPGTGVSVAFAGATSGSFQSNDVWYLYLRTELRVPTNTAMSTRLENGALMCSTCHDQHNQTNSPFDPAAPVAAGLNGRHFQRIPNDRDQMCVDCHSARNQTATGGTTHPINLPIPVNGNYTTTRTSAKLDTTSRVQCQSCHKVHYAPTADGTLLRVSNAANLLCNDCHTYKTVATANLGIHFDATSGVVWPGGQYGTALSTYPARTAGERGNCANCHAPHGWPDARNTANHYPGMLVDERSNLCLACHDSNGPSNKDVQAAFAQTGSRHPIDRTSGRMVSCADCHNPHMAKVGIHTAAQGTANGNRVRDTAGTTLYNAALRGADGVKPTTWPTFAAPASGVYQTIATGSPATPASGVEFEWQICFKCHTSYSFGTTPPSSGGGSSVGTFTLAASTTQQAWGTASTTNATFTNGSPNVTGATGTNWATTIVGMAIRRGTTGTAYIISARPTTTTLTLSTNFGQTTVTGTYQMRPSAAITGTTAVTGYGTTWTSAGTLGRYIQLVGSGTSSEITGFTDATHLTIATSTVAATPSDFILHPGARFQSGSTTVTGSGTNWTAAMAGQAIRPEDGTGTYYIVAASPAPTATSLALTTPYVGTTRYYRYSTATVTTTPAISYTDLAAEFNPANRSVHPVVNTLNNQTGSVAPKALTSTLSSPWNTNKGNQTMTCSDCHNTGGAGAQGPHGSAAQFMLKTFSGGQDPANWPNVTLTNRATSWCNNCHSLASSNNVHSRGDHSSQPCYACHIVIPHGGAMSRLIADQNGTMPARYAYNSDKNNVQITSINKRASSSYAEGDCGARCDTGKHPLTNGENW